MGLQNFKFDDQLCTVLERIAQLTKAESEKISPAHKRQYSQYFTEGTVAKQMATMLNIGAGALIGDHGAGTGVLGACVTSIAIDRLHKTHKPINLKAYEIDELLHPSFYRCMDEVQRFAKVNGKSQPEISLLGDFTSVADDLSVGKGHGQLDAVILNPPYQKLNQSSPLAQLMRQHIVPTPNLYAVFIALSVLMLKPGGQMVAIVPRSFTNGTYFKSFRNWLLSHGAIDWFVRYKRRSNIFRGDNVIQENVTFRFVRAMKQPDRVRVSLCDDPESAPVYESMVPSCDVFPNSTDIIYVPANEDELSALHRIRCYPRSTDDMGLTITTGRIEDFRIREYLHHSIDSKPWVPVIYSQHWVRGNPKLHWQATTSNGKPACLEVTPETIKKTIPRGNYVLIKRISANDDRTGRCNPCVLMEDMDIPGDFWGIDNHLQVIGAKEGVLSKSQVIQLSNFLMTSDVDHYLRLVSGTTQLNKDDLLQLRYPEFVDGN